MPAYSLADPIVSVFVILPVLLSGLFALGVYDAWRRAGGSRTVTIRAVMTATIGVVGWMAITAGIAATGALREWDRDPQPLRLLLVGIGALAAAITLSPLGRRLADHLPLWSLVALQAFRLPLELAMHGMYERGIMPVQMSYSGRNFDILTGATAIIVAVLIAIGRGGRALITVWNVIGLILLVNIVAVAVLSTPRFHYFGHEQVNVWITYPPFVWLPAVMVLTALAAHLSIFRAVRERTRD